MSKTHLSLCVGVILLGVSFKSSAQVNGLYNTGVNNSRAVLPSGSIGDPHYQLTSVPSSSSSVLNQIEIATSTTTYPESGGHNTTTTGYPISTGNWTADDTFSRWLEPNPAGNPVGARSGGGSTYDAGDPHTDPVGDYTYQTHFYLGAHAVAINGQFSVDDSLASVYLNGQLLGISGSGGSTWTPFTIGASDFGDFNLDGENTLDFVVDNTGSITGLRVEYSGNTVPDGGSTAALLAGATVALQALRRKLRA
jgi:hypothetical protein